MLTVNDKEVASVIIFSSSLLLTKWWHRQGGAQVLALQERNPPLPIKSTPLPSTLYTFQLMPLPSLLF
jgi:hypothetical protein